MDPPPCGAGERSSRGAVGGGRSREGATLLHQVRTPRVQRRQLCKPGSAGRQMTPFPPSIPRVPDNLPGTLPDRLSAPSVQFPAPPLRAHRLASHSPSPAPRPSPSRVCGVTPAPDAGAPRPLWNSVFGWRDSLPLLGNLLRTRGSPVDPKRHMGYNLAVCPYMNTSAGAVVAGSRRSSWAAARRSAVPSAAAAKWNKLFPVLQSAGAEPQAPLALPGGLPEASEGNRRFPVGHRRLRSGIRPRTRGRTPLPA